MKQFIFEETMENLRQYITDLDTVYKGELLMSDGEKGYILMRFTEQGNHTVLFHADPDTDTLTLDYYPHYHMYDFNNIQAHRSIEILNTLINEVKIHVADNRAIYFSATLDLSEESASVKKIEAIYSCCLFINNVYGDILEECLTCPVPGKDYRDEIHSAITSMFDGLIKTIEKTIGHMKESDDDDLFDDDKELLDDLGTGAGFIDPEDDIKLASGDEPLEIDPEELM